MTCSIGYPAYYTSSIQSSGVAIGDGVIYHDTLSSGCFITFSGVGEETSFITTYYYIPPGDTGYCIDFSYDFYTPPQPEPPVFVTAQAHYLPVDYSATSSGINVLSLGLCYYYNYYLAGTAVVDIPLNIGNNILDMWNDGCYILVCTDQGVEYLNSRTFDSIWYFNSTIVQSVCSNQEKVCFGTVSDGIYYCDVPKNIGDLGNTFLAAQKKVNFLTSTGISDICTTSSGFFCGGESGVDILINYVGDTLKTYCQLTCSGVNSVAYSVETETYYWSTASTVYSADTYI